MDTFGNDFGHFWNSANFLILLKIFEDSTFDGKLGKSFSKRLPQNMFKTRLDTFGNNFGHFWNFETFLIFFEIFRRLDPPWNTGHKSFQNIFPQTCSKHVWILLKTLLVIFGILKIFYFENFRKLDPPWNTGHKIFQKIFPKTCSKHVWIFLRTLSGIFGILKIFFLKIFEDSTFHGKLGKNFSKNLPQNTFKTRLDAFGNDFGHFWNFEKKFENFRKLGPPRNTGQKKISKNLTQNKFKTRLDTFENTFGHFWNFEEIYF